MIFTILKIGRLDSILKYYFSQYSKGSLIKTLTEEAEKRPLSDGIGGRNGKSKNPAVREQKKKAGEAKATENKKKT